MSYFRWIPKVRIKQKLGLGYKVGGVILSDGTQTEIHLSRQTFFSKNSPYSLFPFANRVQKKLWTGIQQKHLIFIYKSFFPVNLELINSLWVPNIFIYNLKTFQVIDVLSKLAGLVESIISYQSCNQGWIMIKIFFLNLYQLHLYFITFLHFWLCSFKNP